MHCQKWQKPTKKLFLLYLYCSFKWILVFLSNVIKNLIDLQSSVFLFNIYFSRSDYNEWIECNTDIGIGIEVESSFICWFFFSLWIQLFLQVSICHSRTLVIRSLPRFFVSLQFAWCVCIEFNCCTMYMMFHHNFIHSKRKLAKLKAWITLYGI